MFSTFRGPSLVVKSSLIETLLAAAGAIDLPLRTPAHERAPAAAPRELDAVH